MRPNDVPCYNIVANFTNDLQYKWSFSLVITCLYIDSPFVLGAFLNYLEGIF